MLTIPATQAPQAAQAWPAVLTAQPCCSSSACSPQQTNKRTNKQTNVPSTPGGRRGKRGESGGDTSSASKLRRLPRRGGVAPTGRRRPGAWLSRASRGSVGPGDHRRQGLLLRCRCGRQGLSLRCRWCVRQGLGVRRRGRCGLVGLPRRRPRAAPPLLRPALPAPCRPRCRGASEDRERD